MRHKATPKFWERYDDLPEDIKRLARKNFALLKADAKHPSLEFKKVGRFWSVRVGIHYRALAYETPEAMTWAWIGHHSEYDQIIG